MALNEEIGKTKEYIKIGNDFKAGDTFDRSDGNINRVTGANQTTVDQRKGNLLKGTELYNNKNSTSIPVASAGSPEPDIQKRCYIIVDKCKYELITTYLKSKQQINVFLIGNQLDYNPHYGTTGGFESSNYFYTLITSLSNYTTYINSWKFNNSRNLQSWSSTIYSGIFISKFNSRANVTNYNTNTSILNYSLQGKSFSTSPVVYLRKRDYVESTNFIADNLPDIPDLERNTILPYIFCNCYTAIGGVGVVPTGDTSFYYFEFRNSQWNYERYKNGSSVGSGIFTKPPCINGIYFAFITNNNASIHTNNGSDAATMQPLDYSGLKINSVNYSNITASFLIAAYPSIDKNYILLIYWYNNSFVIYKASFNESNVSKTVNATYESGVISSLSDFSKDRNYSFAICENTNSLIMYFCYKNSSENHPLYRLSFIK